MKKILVLSMAFLSVLSGNIKLQGAEQEGQAAPGRKSQVLDNMDRLVKDFFASERKEKAELNSKLLQAASAGDTTKVRSLLAAGADKDAQDKNGLTPLHKAVSDGNTEIVEILIAAGSSVNGADKNGLTPLHKAVSDGNIELVKILIAAGASVNSDANNGSTLLLRAVLGGNIELVKILIAARASVNVADVNGFTVLDKAVWNGNTELVKILLAAGALIDVLNSRANASLDRAVRDGNVEIAALLRGKKLFDAIIQDDITAFNDLLTADINLDFKYLRGLTPLALAQKLKRVEMVRLIKQKQLFDAIQKNDTTAFNDLIIAGADIKAQNLRGLTPLHVAAQVGNAQATQELLKAGVDIYATDRFGNTPFVTAAYEAGKDRTNLVRASLVQMLLDAELKQAVREDNPLAVGLLLKGHKYLDIKPTDEAVREALSLAKNFQRFTDDQRVEGGESKYSVGYRSLNAQQKEERSKEVIRLLTESIQKK